MSHQKLTTRRKKILENIKEILTDNEKRDSFQFSLTDGNTDGRPDLYYTPPPSQDMMGALKYMYIPLFLFVSKDDVIKFLRNEENSIRIGSKLDSSSSSAISL